MQTSDPFYADRIKAEITKDLSQAGWQMVPSGGDVAITAIGGTHDKTEYNTFYDGLGGGRMGLARMGWMGRRMGQHPDLRAGGSGRYADARYVRLQHASVDLARTRHLRHVRQI